ncbi:PAS domain S-box protein [Anoxybacterium hadale]|uniref:PAS domain S-box protein n=1 Tax=Anoxybacterium hadale TaxID=3408580 RepID=A0ACD1AAY6_9FIRM|nr:PAS domain S-box protein [Clostridiales bacterium]
MEYAVNHDTECKLQKSEYSFSDYFDIEELQKIQDLFSEATGVASIITEPDGTPITEPSGFCDLCNEIRRTEQGFIHCKNSDAIIGKTNEDGPILHRCYSGGLLDAGASIIVEGKHIANWLIGQVFDEDQPIEPLEAYAASIGLADEVFRRGLAKVKRMSKVQFESVSKFLFQNAQMISRYAKNNLELQRELNKRIQHEHEIEKLNLELEEKSREINKFFDISSDLFSITDIRGNFYRYNKAWKSLLGYTEEDLKEMRYQDYLHPDDLYEYYQVMKQIEESGKNIGFTPRFRHKDGSYRYLEWSCIKEGRYYYSADRDITQRMEAEAAAKETEQTLKESEERFRTIFEQYPIGIALVDTENHKINQANNKFIRIVGRGIDEINEMNWMEFTHPDDLEAEVELWDSFLGGAISSYNINKRYLRPDSGYVWANLTVSKVEADPTEGKKHILMLEDITRRKRAEEEILYYSYHDQLTGLFNRRYFEEEIQKLDKRENLPLSIIVGDVNGFKLFNDAFGHKQGDLLLKRIASIIRSECRPDDIVFRWSGDEFVILLPSTDLDETALLVDRIRENCSQVLINDVSIHISFGWDVKKDPNQSTQEVMTSAENQMYMNKVVESEGLRGSIIKTVINTLHEKSPREEKHSQRVSNISQSIGKALQLSEMELNKLKAVGLLHDIGKIGVEGSILDKAGALTQKEYDEIKKHPEIGFRILNSSEDMQELAEVTLCHHERWDGTGYPKGLRGEEIPILSRIVSIADSYDAMTSDRPYRRALSKEESINQIKKHAGSQFDARIAKIFVDAVVPELQ